MAAAVGDPEQVAGLEEAQLKIGIGQPVEQSRPIEPCVMM
jgi:hypothetical protein